MRPLGHAKVSARSPRAHAICDRCGRRVNHYELSWEYQWAGAHLQNLRLLVCEDCLDIPQEQLRTIVLPADPLPILNPRQEFYDSDDNPLSGQGWDPATLSGFSPTFLGQQFGTLLNYNAAFNGSLNKPFVQCAQLGISVTGFNNKLGINWTGPNSYNGGVPPTQNYALSSFTIQAPNDAPFLNSGATGFMLQGSNDGIFYTTVYQSTTAGSKGEAITVGSSVFTSNPNFGFHQVVFQGDGLSRLGCAQVQFATASVASEEV